MNENDMKVAAEMQLGRFAQKTHGLRMTDMHLRVLELLEQTDKFVMLGLINDMVDELQRNGVKALGPAAQSMKKKQALLLLTDLRRWFAVDYCSDVVECCMKVCELQRRVVALEAENERFNDGWSNRVTYENMVEKIAGYEDVSARDAARSLIEPMLKRDMARKFREDIKHKVQELNGEDGKLVVQGDYVVNKSVNNEVNGIAPGARGINVYNDKE